MNHQLEDAGLCMAWSPKRDSDSGGVLAVGTANGSLAIFFPAESGAHQKQVIDDAHQMGISCMSWSDDQVLATGGQDGNINLWTISNNQCSLLKTLRQCDDFSWVNSLKWLPGGKLLVAVGKSIELWDTHAYNCDFSKRMAEYTVTDLEWIPKIKKFAISTYGRVTVASFDGEELELDLKGSFLNVASCPLGKNMHVVAGGMQDALVSFWVLDQDGTLLSQHKFSGFGEKVMDLRTSFTGEIGAASADAIIIFTLLKNPKPDNILRVPKVCLGHDTPVVSLAFHPSKPLVAGLAADGSVKIWNPNVISHRNPDGTCIVFPIDSERFLPQEGVVSSGIRCEWNASGKYLACSYTNGQVSIFDTASI